MLVVYECPDCGVALRHLDGASDIASQVDYYRCDTCRNVFRVSRRTAGARPESIVKKR